MTKQSVRNTSYERLQSGQSSSIQGRLQARNCSLRMARSNLSRSRAWVGSRLLQGLGLFPSGKLCETVCNFAEDDNSLDQKKCRTGEAWIRRSPRLAYELLCFRRRVWSFWPLVSPFSIQRDSSEVCAWSVQDMCRGLGQMYLSQQYPWFWGFVWWPWGCSTDKDGPGRQRPGTGTCSAEGSGWSGNQDWQRRAESRPDLWVWWSPFSLEPQSTRIFPAVYDTPSSNGF